MISLQDETRSVFLYPFSLIPICIERMGTTSELQFQRERERESVYLYPFSIIPLCIERMGTNSDL